MIEDARTLQNGAVLNAPLCIIGAGPAGISLAMQFIGAGIDVLLMEAGDRGHVDANQALYAGEVADEALHSPLDQYRHRQFGGSSATWGGRCMPFDPIDFEDRDWIKGSGWPIGHGEVAKHYPQAMALAEAGDPIFDAEAAVEGAMCPMIEGFSPSSFDDSSLERFSCPTNFAHRYGHRLEAARNIRVVLNANCIGLDAEGETIHHAQFRTLTGISFTVKARHFVLATGGIEVARLMLASRGKAHPNGLGNAGDQVGRTYMCHIAGTYGAVQFKPGAGRVWHGYEQAWDGSYCRRRLALRAERQREHRIGNVVMRLHHPRLPDPAHGRGILSAIYLAKPFISYEYAKRLHGGEAMSAGLWLRHALNIMREPFGTLGFLLNWIRVRTLAARKFPSLIVAPRNGCYSLDIHAEQLPNPDSRITLGAGRDALDMPQARVDWRYLPGDIETVRVSLALLRADLAAWGGADLAYEDDGIEAAMIRDGAYGGHHIGTARMGKSPGDGVVDGDCRVFGTTNLSIASAATFPTSSQANPTLTIIAMALRLADHLKPQLVPVAPALSTGEFLP